MIILQLLITFIFSAIYAIILILLINLLIKHCSLRCEKCCKKAGEYESYNKGTKREYRCCNCNNLIRTEYGMDI